MVAALALAACTAAPVDTASSAPPVASIPAASRPAAAPPTYLFDLMAQPPFAAALRALPQSAALPKWVWQGGTATPARTLQVDGTPMLLASACKPHACPLERIALLYDATHHAMSGLYATRPEAIAALADPDDDSRDALTWLGSPDAAQREVLHAALYSR